MPTAVATRGNVRTFRFTPGRVEHLHLSVWKRSGRLFARLEGSAYVACGMGNEHYVDVDQRYDGWPSEADFYPATALLVRAHAGDEDAARDLVDELEGWALEDWFDPCDTDDEEDF